METERSVIIHDPTSPCRPDIAVYAGGEVILLDIVPQQLTASEQVANREKDRVWFNEETTDMPDRLRIEVAFILGMDEFA